MHSQPGITASIQCWQRPHSGYLPSVPSPTSTVRGFLNTARRIDASNNGRRDALAYVKNLYSSLGGPVLAGTGTDPRSNSKCRDLCGNCDTRSHVGVSTAYTDVAHRPKAINGWGAERNYGAPRNHHEELLMTSPRAHCVFRLRVGVPPTCAPNGSRLSCGRAEERLIPLIYARPAQALVRRQSSVTELQLHTQVPRPYR